jgi:nucleoside-diphosphate-sugar epimerase
VSSRATTIAVRAAVDFVLINLAFALAYGGRVIWGFYTSDLSAEGLTAFIEGNLELYQISVGLVVGVTMIVFAAFGIYTGRRFYGARYKIVTILQASGVSGLAYLMVLFLLYRDGLPPRTVVLSTFTLVFLFCGGVRWIKWTLESRYQISPRQPERLEGVTTVLVVGGAGHLGSVLCRQLLDDGYRVRCLDILMFGDAPIRELYNHERFELIEGDFRNVETVVKATVGTDAVVHLGAIVGDPACAVDEDYSVDVNYAATRMIREVCRGFGVRRFVFASTCSVYGAAASAIDESSRLNPVSLYAQTKIDSESAILSLHDPTFSPTVLRLATVFGLSPRPRFDLAVNVITAMAVADGECAIFGGAQWRPFIHTTDVARAIARVLSAREEVVAGEVFNVGDDQLNLQLSEVGDIVERLVPEAVVRREEDNVDRRDYRVSFKKIRDRLGFTCEVTVEDGVREIKQAIETGLIGDFRAAEFSNLNYLRRLREVGHPSASRLRDTGERIRALKNV